ncbi:two-component system sensor histidine kinase RcsC [Photorhabdus aegyptia]|uniref:two-component system sensor histidine kinase RcsC n=1 Tax=Photorhabdus aegyptia TaxID=2805098 RepID=UPI001E48F5AF|nr:two-component system sensor histidine kinase RcsC [Photorhabdus aegyptia]MCC8456401.1 two-component system sensor histidine kinase RcsC [Photorhabdus aegyptia]
MRYLSSFRTSLKISRYLFRVLGLMLWALGALLTAFYLVNIFNEVKSDIRQEYNANYDSTLSYVRHTASVLRDIQYMTEKHLLNSNGKNAIFDFPHNSPAFSYHPLNQSADCRTFRNNTHSYLNSLNNLIFYWKDNLAAPQGLNQVFLVGTQSMCMVNFSIRNTSTEPDTLKKIVYENSRRLISLKDQGKERNVYWVIPGARSDSGHLYVLAPVYVNGQMVAMIGIEQFIRLDSFIQRQDRPISITLLNRSNQPVLHYPANDDYKLHYADYQLEAPYFGYDDNFTDLLLKRRLMPSSFSIIYALPLKTIFEGFKLQIISSIVLNVLSACVIIILVYLFERKMFAPAEENAIRLEEHEQFNHKIVASAPVGISILRVSDGSNILSNELAHNYLRMLTHEDRERIIHIICDRTSSYVDVVTSNHHHLQISFVHSRYRNEEVAICVLVDISVRVRMEKSLQEMALASEQANYSKSMFLATVSHELRTPLYGIIGNLELLQAHSLPIESIRLLSTMNNSSALLLKIISDILDFSKIESKQLKIESREFSCQEVISHVISNYLPLVVKKPLTLYCYIEPDVPDYICNDPVRLQQVISNLLNNAIKFTDTGCVVIHVTVDRDYLYVRIKDTGVGISDKALVQLFDPFFQIMPNTESSSQGTGLGLAICEKLINLMDGDIEVISQPQIGSMFSIRLPLYGAKYRPNTQLINEHQRKIILAIRNLYLEEFLQRFLVHHGLHTILYSGQSTDGSEIIISDFPDAVTSPVYGYIELSTDYIGSPEQIRENYWLHNTYHLHDFPVMIERLISSNHNVVLNTAPPVFQVNTRFNTIMVLVVDDHPINRRLLADQLKSIGFQTVMANDGLDALEYLKEGGIDIILTDVNMPNMDGYALTMYLRNEGCKLPIIGITANALAEEKQRCIDAGMNDCLSKPVSLVTLRQVLTEMI